MQSLIRCSITRYSTINLSNPLFIFDFWKLDSFLAQLTELLLSFCRRQWNNFEKSKCMGREYNRCLLVKKYSPSLVFTNMSFTDGRRWSQNGLRWILLRTSASRAGCQGLWLVNNSAYGFGNARIYMRRRALGRDWVNNDDTDMRTTSFSSVGIFHFIVTGETRLELTTFLLCYVNLVVLRSRP